MSDERLKRSAGAEVRGDARITETVIKEGDRATSDEVRVEAFMDEWVPRVLPDPPKISGYHFCWLSTENSSDTIMQRKRLGYELVKASELGPEWQETGYSGQGEYNGIVCAREMLLAKIPEARYQAVMRYFHDTQPNEMDADNAESMNRLKALKDSAGKRLVQEEADDSTYARPVQPNGPPRFT